MISVNDKWGKLRELVLGRSYPSEFYSNIKNPRIRSCLSRIADETEEDYLYFETQLKNHGVIVHRPEIDKNDRIEKYVNKDGQIKASFQNINEKIINTAESSEEFVSNTLIPRPPMTPRDSWAIIDGDLILASPDHISSNELLKKLAAEKNCKIIESYAEFGVDFSGGNLFPVGEDIFLGSETLSATAIAKIKSRYPRHRWHFVDISGHNDGVYHPIKPGAILSLVDLKTYQHEFPGWDILYLPNQSWHKVKKFLKIKNQNQGKWWVPGEEENQEFTTFVESWLQNWVGFVEETVFDVNCLVFDDNFIFVNNYNKEVFDFLKKHQIEPIIIPFRHRYFWDGGLHCITLELHREGPLKKYL